MRDDEDAGEAGTFGDDASPGVPSLFCVSQFGWIANVASPNIENLEKSIHMGAT